MSTRNYGGKRRPNPPTKTEGTRGFNLGWNTQSHPTTIRKNELAEAQNVLYSQNGVLSKRPGSENIGDPRGDSTYISALGSVYDIGDPPQRYLLRISEDGILQRFSFNSESWIDVAGSPTFTTVDDDGNKVNIQILQAYGFVYILSPEDLITKWDGTSFTTNTPLANPTDAPTLAKVGTGTGNRTLYYRYVWYNNVNGTLASPNASLGSLPEELDADTYVTVTLPAAPANTERVGIFRGRTSGDEVFLAWVPAAQTVYSDKNFDEEDPTTGVPESNATAGFHFKFADVYRDTLIGVTKEEGDDTLVFSGGGDKFDTFGRADGGGYYAWRKGDGDPISAVHSFQDSLYVFKRRKVGAFKFDEEGGTVTDINLAVGSVSHWSVHAAGNDLRFWAEDGARSLGNEPNFANIIRTKVLSARADKLVQSLTPKQFPEISGIYYKGISIWGIPTGGINDGITSSIAYDEKYVAWSEWLGLTPGRFVKYIDADNNERLFFSDSQSGNVVEGWKGTSDNGNPIVWRVATKQFDMDAPHRWKTFLAAYFIFGNVQGRSTRITLVEDGQRTQTPLAIYQDVGDQGFGVDMWGDIAFGESSGEFTGDTSGLITRFVNLNKPLFSLQAVLQNDGVTDQIQFMGLFLTYRDSTRPLPSRMRLERLPA